MDPYLEPHCLDVYTRLVTYSADELNRVLPVSLVARAEERVAIGADLEESREIGPDVRVFSPASSDPSVETATIAIDAPFKLVLETDPITERFIRILDSGGELITVIEFISPTNKLGGLEAYREKRQELLSAGVKVVEIDLTRKGNWRALLRPHVCPPEAVADYRATIRTSPMIAYLYPMPLRSRLADIQIPLRAKDPRILLPLQKLVDQVYLNGRYASTIRYEQPCEPQLGDGDEAWAKQMRERNKK